MPDLPDGLWDLPWRRSEQVVSVTDPIYGQQRSLQVTRVDTAPGRSVTFAVCEVSNGIYLFAIPL